MSRIVYVNGEYVAEDQARVSVFDRGFLFADAVYEVAAVLNSRLVDNNAHLQRLQRSLSEVGFEAPVDTHELEDIQQTLIQRNQLNEGLIYLQMTRGVADRAFACPPGTRAGLVMFTQARELVDTPQAEHGIAVIVVPDVRWRRRDIKSTGLLGPVLAMHAARQAGADDAWLMEDRHITEGSNNNAYIVTPDSTVITRHLGHEILPGVTRSAVIDLLADTGARLEQRPFSRAEALAASEAFITSATAFVVPVVNIDGQPIGDGKPGPFTTRLRELYVKRALAQTSVAG